MRYSIKTTVFSYVILGIGFLIIVNHLFREKIATKDDLKTVSTTMLTSGYYAVPVKSRRYGITSYIYSYHVRSFRYGNDFQIAGNIGKDFDKDSFEKEVHPGDSITMLIPISDFNQLSTKEVIRIFGIYTHKTTYMDYNNCIHEYRSAGSGKLFFGIIFLIAGYFHLQWAKNREALKQFAFAEKLQDD